MGHYRIYRQFLTSSSHFVNSRAVKLRMRTAVVGWIFHRILPIVFSTTTRRKIGTKVTGPFSPLPSAATSRNLGWGGTCAPPSRVSFRVSSGGGNLSRAMTAQTHGPRLLLSPHWRRPGPLGAGGGGGKGGGDRRGSPVNGREKHSSGIPKKTVYRH